MPTRISNVSENCEWKRAYMAAIQERDTARVTALIQDARAKLSTRLRELKNGSPHCEEVEAIHDADYMLHALQTSLAFRDVA